jgi:uncharacterized membrane protein YeaQ/YmgE (transglycosylase-associated protein family)
MIEQTETAGEQPAVGRPRPASRLRAAARDAGAVLGCYLVVGLMCGVIWWLLVDPATFTKVGDGGSMGELELGNRFNGDGWYAVVAGVAGLVSGVVLTWWRSRDFLLTVVLLVAGSAVAAIVMAWTGHWLGPGDPDAALKAAEVGEQVPVQLEVTATAGYLVWPITALIGALIVLWSPPQGTER